MIILTCLKLLLKKLSFYAFNRKKQEMMIYPLDGAIYSGWLLIAVIYHHKFLYQGYNFIPSGLE